MWLHLLFPKGSGASFLFGSERVMWHPSPRTKRGWNMQISSHWRVGICLSPGMTWAPHEHCRLWEGLTTRLNPEPLSGGAASCLYSLLFRFSVTLWPSVISLLTPPPIKATLAKLHREVQKMSFSSFLRLSPWDFYRMTPLFHFLCVQHK